jgi:hypothetical protein
VFVESIDMREGILKGKKWANREISKVKIVSGLAERTEFPAAGAPIGHPQDSLTARVITIMCAVGRPIDIKPVTEIGKIEAATSGVHVNVAGWSQISPSISIATHEADCEVIGDPIINPYDKAACCEVVALCAAIVIDRYPVSPTVAPKANVAHAGIDHLRLATAKKASSNRPMTIAIRSTRR